MIEASLNKKSMRRKIIIALVFLAPWLIGVDQANAYDRENISFHGFYDLEYLQGTANEGKGRTADSDITNGSFDQHHLNLLIDARATKELKVKAQIEFDHGADTERGLGGVILEYGFAEYSFNNQMKTWAGKILTPFGLYNEIHDASPAFMTVTIPWVIYKSHTMGGFRMVPKWVTGASLLGGYGFGKRGAHHIDYVLYLGNGESLAGTNDSRFDDNPNKAIGARVQYACVNDIAKVSFSYYNGDKAVSEDKLAVPHWTGLFSIETEWRKFNIQSEVGFSELGGQQELAYYLQGSYRLGKFTPYIRYQSLDPDNDASDDEWRTVIIGGNFMVNDHLFLKFEWNQHSRGVNNSDIINPGDENFGEFRSALTVHF